MQTEKELIWFRNAFIGIKISQMTILAMQATTGTNNFWEAFLPREMYSTANAYLVGQ